MKKPKAKDHIQEFRQLSLDDEVEQIESLLAPTVMKCLNAYGKRSIRHALIWLIKSVDEKNENEPDIGEILNSLELAKPYEDEDESARV